MTQKILIVGIGVMGAPMAKNIINAGFDVAVCDESSDALVDFHDIATLVSTSPSKAALNRNVIITVLPNSDIVENVLFGEEGALASAAPNSLVVDMSTGSYDKTMKIAKKIEKLGHKFVDAPVGRTPREALTGQLLVMVGGEEQQVKELNGIFKAVGNTIIHVGETGCGLKAKLVNNYMAMINNVVTGETLSLANSVGLDVGLMADLMSTTAAGLGQLNTNYPKKVLSGDLKPDFPIFMAIKDLTMAIELAEGHDAVPKFGRLARKTFEGAKERGMGSLDQTAIMKYLMSDDGKNSQ